MTRAASYGSRTRYRARVSPGPTLTPASGPCRWANAFSSVTSSPMNTTALAEIWVRSASTAMPLWVAITDSSTTSLPWVTLMPGQVAGPVRIASSTTAATSGAAARVCTATLAGLTSRRTPGRRRTSADNVSTSSVRSCCASGASASTNPTSNSEPWLPTRCTSLGSRDSAARSRRARPDITATVVCGRLASARTAATASLSGTALVGSATIGASVPS